MIKPAEAKSGCRTINLRTAKEIGLDFSHTMLLRADHVIQ